MYIPIEYKIKIMYIYDGNTQLKLILKSAIKYKTEDFSYEFKRLLFVFIPGNFSDSFELYMKSTKIWMHDMMSKWNSCTKE